MALERIALHYVIRSVQLAVHTFIAAVFAVYLLVAVNNKSDASAVIGQCVYRNIVKLCRRHFHIKRYRFVSAHCDISLAAVLSVIRDQLCSFRLFRFKNIAEI